MITETDIRNILRHRCEAAGGQSALAREIGMSSQFINFVVNGEREVSERLARKLGYQRKVVFTRCNTQVDDV
tara:strand:- start:1469 stop:1684 length:216 start_codon:yes stop_codon:yes gene_type:complete